VDIPHHGLWIEGDHHRLPGDLDSQYVFFVHGSPESCPRWLQNLRTRVTAKALEISFGSLK
jgi:hypothetical protein